MVNWCVAFTVGLIVTSVLLCSVTFAGLLVNSVVLATSLVFGCWLILVVV